MKERIATRVLAIESFSLRVVGHWLSTRKLRRLTRPTLQANIRTAWILGGLSVLWLTRLLPRSEPRPLRTIPTAPRSSSTSRYRQCKLGFAEWLRCVFPRRWIGLEALGESVRSAHFHRFSVMSRFLFGSLDSSFFEASLALSLPCVLVACQCWSWASYAATALSAVCTNSRVGEFVGEKKGINGAMTQDVVGRRRTSDVVLKVLAIEQIMISFWL